MTFPNRIPLTFLCTALLGACDSGSEQNSSNELYTLPFEDTPAHNAASIQVLDQNELDILNQIKQRSADDGARYQFDQLSPVFEQDGDTMTVSFNHVDTNTVGGAPSVEYSLSQRKIISIVYTQ